MNHKPFIYYLSYVFFIAVIVCLLVVVYHMGAIGWKQVPYAFQTHFGGR